REALRQTQRELAERRSVFRIALHALRAVAGLAVAVEVVADAMRPRLARSVLVDRRRGEAPRQMEDAAEHDAIALVAARASELRLDVGGIVGIAGREVGAEVVADVLLVGERE